MVSHVSPSRFEDYSPFHKQLAVFKNCNIKNMGLTQKWINKKQKIYKENQSFTRGKRSWEKFGRVSKNRRKIDLQSLKLGNVFPSLSPGPQQGISKILSFEKW